MHHRQQPKTHRFHYKVFMFCIDLDELELLNKKLLFFSHNRFNLFSFRDAEHLQLPADRPDKSKNTKAHLLDYLHQHGLTDTPAQILLLTNLNVLGYNFNPVSFYFCLDAKQRPLCCVTEVSNTFREMKPYFLGPDTFDGNKFVKRVTKYFYVSPFIDHDASFDFQIGWPGEKLNIRIDDVKDGERFFISTLTGRQKKLTNLTLLGYSLRFPLIPLRIMGLIHWQAFLLWLKKIRYYKKSEHKDLQRNILKSKD